MASSILSRRSSLQTQTQSKAEVLQWVSFVLGLKVTKLEQVCHKIPCRPILSGLCTLQLQFELQTQSSLSMLCSCKVVHCTVKFWMHTREKSTYTRYIAGTSCPKCVVKSTDGLTQAEVLGTVCEQVNFEANSENDYIPNYKQLQQALTASGATQVRGTHTLCFIRTAWYPCIVHLH